jgi:hypothetical protein
LQTAGQRCRKTCWPYLAPVPDEFQQAAPASRWGGLSEIALLLCRFGLIQTQLSGDRL